MENSFQYLPETPDEKVQEHLQSDSKTRFEKLNEQFNEKLLAFVQVCLAHKEFVSSGDRL